jgi:membrane protease YdiL (CAAX protease family)
MQKTSEAHKYPITRNLGAAAAAIGLVIGGEYFFRHYVLFWLPTIGSLVVNDMLSLFLVYSLLLISTGVLFRVNWGQELAGVGRALWEGLSSWRFTIWVLGLLFSVVVLSQADQLLWGKLKLPMFISSCRNPSIWLADYALPLQVVARVFVNGLFVPIAEEYLWRGIVQVHLARVIPVPVAIGATAVFFSLKHVLVDASLGRCLALIAFGTICGVVAQRTDWKESASMHIIVNSTSTLAGILFGLG